MRRRLLPLLLAACAFGAFAHAQTTPDTTTPVAIVPGIANSQVFTTFSVSGANASSTYQWRLNGTPLSGETGATLTLVNVQPQNTGFYSVDVVDQIDANNVSTRTASTVLGLNTTAKIVGSAVEVGTDIQHPNGNVYDQVLLNGPAATIKADAGQVTRVSFLDFNDDIVQVEFSGAGSASISLDYASAPAEPTKYNQPGVKYVKGHPTIVITDANETTHLAIFSVGTLNAVNQALFKDTIYDGHANLAAVAILSADGKFGGIRAGNASFLAAKSYTGIYAPNVAFTAPVVLGEVTAGATATPVILLGGSTEVHIAGGELLQLNGAPVQVSGFSHLFLDAGMSSHGVALPAKPLAGKLQENGVDVTQRANPI